MTPENKKNTEHRSTTLVFMQGYCLQADVLVNLITCDSHDLSKNGAISSAFLDAAGSPLQQVNFCSFNHIISLCI